MNPGTSVRITFGKLRGKRGDVVKVDGRFATVRGSFGTTTVLISELEAE